MGGHQVSYCTPKIPSADPQGGGFQLKQIMDGVIVAIMKYQ